MSVSETAESLGDKNSYQGYAIRDDLMPDTEGLCPASDKRYLCRTQEKASTTEESTAIQCQYHSSASEAPGYITVTSSPLGLASSCLTDVRDDTVGVSVLRLLGDEWHFKPLRSAEKTMEVESSSGAPPNGHGVQVSASRQKPADEELQSVEIPDQVNGGLKRPSGTPPKIIICLATEDEERKVTNRERDTEESGEPMSLKSDDAELKDQNGNVAISNISGSVEEEVLFEGVVFDLTELKALENAGKPDIDSIFSTDDDDSDKSLSIFPEKLYNEDTSDCSSYKICHSDSWEELFRPDGNDLIGVSSVTTPVDHEEIRYEQSLGVSSDVAVETDEPDYIVASEEGVFLMGDARRCSTRYSVNEIETDDPKVIFTKEDQDHNCAYNESRPDYCDGPSANVGSDCDRLFKSKICVEDADRPRDIEISEGGRAVLETTASEETLYGITEECFVTGGFLPEVANVCIPAVSKVTSADDTVCITVRTGGFENIRTASTVRGTEGDGRSTESSGEASTFNSSASQMRLKDDTLAETAVGTEELSNQKRYPTADGFNISHADSLRRAYSNEKLANNDLPKENECTPMEATVSEFLAEDERLVSEVNDSLSVEHSDHPLPEKYEKSGSECVENSSESNDIANKELSYSNNKLCKPLISKILSFPCGLPLNTAPVTSTSVGTSTSEDYPPRISRVKSLNDHRRNNSSPSTDEQLTEEIRQELSANSYSLEKEDDDASTSTEVDSDITPSRDSIPDVSGMSEMNSEEIRFVDSHIHDKIMEEDTPPSDDLYPEKEEVDRSKEIAVSLSLSPRRKSFWPPTVSAFTKPPESKVRRNKSSPETCPTPSASGVSLTRSHSFIRRNASSPSLRSLDSSADISFRSDVARKPTRITSSRSSIHLRRYTERPSEVAVLTESALGSLYVPFDTVRTQLVRQAREVLLCRYQGDYWKFRQRFLQPAAALLNELKETGQQRFLVGKDEKQLPCHSCCSQKWKGWPLNVNRRLLIQLGELDAAILKAGDFYLCVQETRSGVALLLKYWTEKGGVGKRVIHAPQYSSLFTMDWLEESESPNDDDLTSLLQHLLVSVERGIERIEWKSVERPWTCGYGYPGGCCHVGQVDTKDTSVQTSPDGGEIEEEQKEPLEDASSKKSPEEENEDRSVSSEGFQNAQRPTTIGQVDQDLLHSGVAVLPGCRDVQGRSVVVIFGSQVNEKVSSPCQLAQLLAYYHIVPTREVIRRGFLVLVDGRGASKDSWTVLDDTFRLLENIVPNCISLVLVWRSDDDNEVEPPSGAFKCEVVSAEDRMRSFVKEEHLLVDFGGKYTYDHQEWICFRKFLEPFVSSCRISGRHLVRVMQSLRANQLPTSSSVTHHLIEEQKSHINQTFHDDQLRHLEEEGDTILRELESYGTRSPHNIDYRECLMKTSSLYRELRLAMGKLSKLADKRLTRLEECLQMKMLEEESSQVLTWLCRKGEEMLGKHQAVADSLGGIRDQEEEFEKFYFVAMRQIEKGNDLLEEAAMIGNEAAAELPAAPPPPPDIKCNTGGVQEITSSLKHHLNNFTERLEDTRERLEDTAKCYHLLDKAYEWALEAMRFVSHMRMDNISNPEMLSDLMKVLQEYMDEHAAIPEETFQEMIDLATKLGKETLLEQCKVAHAKCQETVDLIQTRQTTLQKIKQQLEADTSRQSSWDSDEPSTPRTSRSKSQPGNLWVSQQSSTPFQQIPSSQLFSRRRSSVATVSPQPYGSPMGSYTSFPSNYYLIVNHKDNYQLDYFIQEKEQQILTHGLITDDLTTQGPVASIPRTILEARSIRSGVSSSKNSSSGSCSSKTGSLGSSSCNQILIPYHQPIRKYMRRGHTWQMCEEALERAKTEVREQNERLKMERLLPGVSGSSNESIMSVPENDSRNSDGCSRIPLTHTQSDPLRGPVPVNSHLLTRASSLELQDASVTDEQLNEDQVKAKKTLMLIMREMIQTERDYVKSLEYTIENYLPELLREDIPQALRGQRNTIFGNIEKIYEFHSQYFLQELEQSENSPFTVGQCFLHYERQFYLYALYNKNKPKSDALMSEYGTLFFRKKQLELGDKMDLASYLLKPVQRMGKYALLLKQLLKECPERDAEHQDLRAAEEMVRFQLRHGNDLLAMDALRDCDVNVKEQGQLLRQDEFLVWQGRSRKSLRHVFLFEDLILFSKARRDPERKGHEIYQYKHSIKTTDIGLTEQVGDSPTKFEIWFRKRKLNDTYILQAPSPEIRIAWVQEISKLLWKQALRNREMRLAEMSSMGIGSKPCLDIKPSEDQISNRSIDIRPLNRGHRFRNSIAVASFDQLHNKRPHSIISVSSSSSSGSSQSSFTYYGALNLGFEPGDSPRPLHRSLTQQSQCSTESGFCTDVSLAGDSPPDTELLRHHKKAERSDSLLSNDSLSLEITGTDFNIAVGDSHTIADANVTECHNIDVK